MDDSHINITKAILANPVVIDGLYFEHLWFVYEENVLYQGIIVAVKLSKNCKVYKVTATYWKRGGSQEDGDDVSMTLYVFFVVYIIQMICALVKLMYNTILCFLCVCKTCKKIFVSLYVVAIAKRTKTVTIFYALRTACILPLPQNPMFGSL